MRRRLCWILDALSLSSSRTEYTESQEQVEHVDVRMPAVAGKRTVRMRYCCSGFLTSGLL